MGISKMNITIEKAKKVILELLKDREYSNIKISDNIIKCDKVLVYFSEEDKISINHIKEFIVNLNEEEYDHGIFIYPNTITPSAKKATDIIDKKIELFESTELQYNITKHRLVPIHNRLKGEELQNIRNKYVKNIPFMLITDPISRYYGYKKGDIIKINRSGIIAYRLVI